MAKLNLASDVTGKSEWLFEERANVLQEWTCVCGLDFCCFQWAETGHYSSNFISWNVNKSQLTWKLERTP